jgi:hypothetical protein
VIKQPLKSGKHIDDPCCTEFSTNFRDAHPPAARAACRACFQTSGVRNCRIEPESDAARRACRRAFLADARAGGVGHGAAMGPSLW